ncbi:hypothetical protein ACP8H2_09350 [Bacillus subtilis]|uniref:hypothetical protein n=1 Tax=Bacillus subtilis TaxID=1423 RepID=UPI003CECDFCF
MDSIKRMFYQEVRDKKRIGTNIFSRVSTRKGGSNQALRTPYLYMSNKERRQLNGEVKVTSMKDIIGYKEFKLKDSEEQKRLLTYWRNHYSSSEIKEKLGISSKTYYKLINVLDVPKIRYNSHKLITLTDEEIEKYSKVLINFDKFRKLPIELKLHFLDIYVNEFGSVKALSEHWEGAELSYLYSVRSNRKRVNEDSSNNTAENIHQHEDQLALKLNQVADDQEKSVQKVDSGQDLSPAIKETVHSSDIELNTNTFTFSLNGVYDAKTIKKRLELALEALEDEGEMLSLEIKITNKKN